MQSLRACSLGLYVLSLSFSANAQQSSQSMGSSTVRSVSVQDQVGVGAKLSIVDVDSLGDPVVGVGAYTDWAYSNHIAFEGALDYWRKSSGTLADESVSVSDIALGGMAKLYFNPTTQALRPFVGVGLSMHRFSVAYKEARTDSNGIDRYERKDTDVEVKGTLDFAGGVRYAVQNQLDAIGEIKYRSIIDPDTDLDQLALAGGLSYKM